MTNSKLDKHLLEILKLIFIVIFEMYHSIEIIFLNFFLENIVNQMLQIK